MKFSVEYVKKNPILFGVIFIVFGVVLWFFLNRNAEAGSGAGSGSVQVVAQGPSEAEIMAGAAVQQASIAAGAAVRAQELELAKLTLSSNASLAALDKQIQGELGLAGLDYSYRAAELASAERVANNTMETQIAALGMNLDYSYRTTVANNQFQVDFARTAYDSANTALAINAGLQRDLSAQQLEAYRIGTEAQSEAFRLGTLAGVIPTLKKGQRDNAYAALLNAETGTTGYLPLNPNAGSGGGFNLSNLSPVGALL